MMLLLEYIKDGLGFKGKKCQVCFLGFLVTDSVLPSGFHFSHLVNLLSARARYFNPLWSKTFSARSICNAE